MTRHALWLATNLPPFPDRWIGSSSGTSSGIAPTAQQQSSKSSQQKNPKQQPQKQQPHESVAESIDLFPLQPPATPAASRAAMAAEDESAAATVLAPYQDLGMQHPDLQVADDGSWFTLPNSGSGASTNPGKTYYCTHKGPKSMPKLREIVVAYNNSLVSASESTESVEFKEDTHPHPPGWDELTASGCTTPFPLAMFPTFWEADPVVAYR